MNYEHVYDIVWAFSRATMNILNESIPPLDHPLLAA